MRYFTVSLFALFQPGGRNKPTPPPWSPPWESQSNTQCLAAFSSFFFFFYLHRLKINFYKASPSFYPTLTRHLSYISDRSQAVKRRRGTEAVCGSLVDCLKKGARRLPASVFDTQGWWRSSCQGQCDWWGQLIRMEPDSVWDWKQSTPNWNTYLPRTLGSFLSDLCLLSAIICQFPHPRDKFMQSPDM